jgi:DNA-binding transcriptional LysR family regulator
MDRMMTITRMHIRAMDLNLLPVLAALFEAKSVSRAAGLLNLTQPAVSRALARLRDHFRDALFVRGQGGLAPTARALAIQPVLSEMLGDLEGLLAPAKFDAKTLVREFVLTGSDYCENVLLPPLLSAVRKRAPGVTLRLTSITDKMWEQLEQGKIDLIVLPESSMQPNTRRRFLFSDPYVCLAAKKHPKFAASWTWTPSARCRTSRSGPRPAIFPRAVPSTPFWKRWIASAAWPSPCPPCSAWAGSWRRAI